MKHNILQNPGAKKVMAEMAQVAAYLWERGWAERNAGNMSVNLGELVSWREKGPGRVQEDRRKSGMDRQLILVTASGRRMRDLAAEPGKHVCLLNLGKNGKPEMFPDEENDLKPTSELAAHLSIQQMLINKAAAENAILHTHVTEIIALTQSERFKSEGAINQMLWGMHPEAMLFIPDGVGFIPYSLPGTEYIGEITCRSFETHKIVIWEKHGCMAIGASLSEAFDLIDILAKSARIWLNCKAAGFEPEGLSAAQMREIRESFQPLG